ncbi:MAG: hypothetical protein ACOC38_10845 [Promethearchaeia archaeon]
MSEAVVYYIVKGRLIRMPRKGAFGKSDCYLVDAGEELYLWVGSEQETEEHTLAQAAEVLKQMKEKDIELLRLPAGHEPREFRDFFPAFRVTTESAERFVQEVATRRHEHRLWMVHKIEGEVWFREVPAHEDSLESDSVFVLDTWEKFYIWRGKDADTADLDPMVIVRGYDARRIGPRDVSVVDEGEESEGFKQDLITDQEEKLYSNM